MTHKYQTDPTIDACVLCGRDYQAHYKLAEYIPAKPAPETPKPIESMTDAEIKRLASGHML